MSAWTRSGLASTPAARNVRARPTTLPVLSIRWSGATDRLREQGGQPAAGDAVVVLAVLQHCSEGSGRSVGVELLGTEREQGFGPVEGLGDPGRLEQVFLA